MKFNINFTQHTIVATIVLNKNYIVNFIIEGATVEFFRLFSTELPSEPVVSLVCSFDNSKVLKTSILTQHPMPPKYAGKWGTECLNTRFPLPTLL